jgi:hypothetical protein
LGKGIGKRNWEKELGKGIGKSNWKKGIGKRNWENIHLLNGNMLNLLASFVYKQGNPGCPAPHPVGFL